jgi:hypothetical protein
MPPFHIRGILKAGVCVLVQKLIAEGAVDLVVPGVLPNGCFPMYLSIFRKEQPEMYGPRSGCIKDLNTLSWVHNALLQRKIAELRRKHPGVRIVYADYYTAVMQFVLHAEKWGESLHFLVLGFGGLFGVPCVDSVSVLVFVYCHSALEMVTHELVSLCVMSLNCVKMFIKLSPSKIIFIQTRYQRRNQTSFQRFHTFVNLPSTDQMTGQ